ncbi:60S ribosomal protein L22-like isoform X1 [Electrophorus electricus]|uniref:60S ribosomal protein L22-like isoform X1 n=1 Tax=Electrophorus electricus TaxID=8005 RepID=UPI0015CFFD51|nr:60S ribosomal protein L22-like isoform X1 [Electrophorus electricus]
MKPDGDATVRAEPTEALEAELEVEAAASEEQPQQDQNSSPPQPKEPENINEAPDSTAAPPDKEANGRKPDPKNKTKAPVKTRLGPSGTKATTMMGTASRPGATQNRAANSLTRTTANGAAKRPAQSELKKAAPARVAAQVKRGPPTVAVVQKTQVKAAEQKPGGTSRPAAASVNSGPSPATSTLSTLNKKPAAAANSAAPKPKTTATRPATASAVKPSIAASSKAAPVPKTASHSRPATAPVPRSTTSSVPVKPTTKPTASRTAASAPPTARSASSQPSKFSATTAAVKKDVGNLPPVQQPENPLLPAAPPQPVLQLQRPQNLKSQNQLQLPNVCLQTLKGHKQDLMTLDPYQPGRLLQAPETLPYGLLQAGQLQHPTAPSREAAVLLFP